MIPKLVSATGLLALTAGSSLIVMASCDSGIDHAYALNVSPDGQHHKIDGKPGLGYYELNFAGDINWEFTNATDASVTVRLQDFGPGANGKCPVIFGSGGDGPSECSATQVIGVGGTKVITATRGDSDLENTTKYPFKFTVNAWPVDPDIEIERDPYSLIHYIVASFGVILTGFGLWLGRQKA